MAVEITANWGPLEHRLHAEFEKLLRDRNHMGVRNFIGDVILEPRNPFQRARRSRGQT